jgi:hypothetical protein
VLLGTGDGLFQPAIRYTTGASPHRVIVTNIAADNIPDLAVAAAGNSRVDVLEGAGDGTFRAAGALTVGAYPVALEAADMNGDGITDLVTADYDGRSITVLLGRGGRVFGKVQTMLSVIPDWLAVADINGDGLKDVIVTSERSGAVAILLGTGDGRLQEPVLLNTGRGPARVSAGDLNKDGRPDLVVSNMEEGTLSVLLNESQPVARPTAPEPLSPVANAVITQNDPGIGCQLHDVVGYGYRIRFRWSPATSERGIAGYELMAQNLSAGAVLVNASATGAEYDYTRCNAYTIATGLEGWSWRVRAKDGDGNYSVWSAAATFRFGACKFPDGRACGEAPRPNFTTQGRLAVVRSRHTATLLPGGKVLLAGGVNYNTRKLLELNSAELYDPVAGATVGTATLRAGRASHTATLLNDGRVLIAGGGSASSSPDGNLVPLASAEIYNASTGAFDVAGAMTTARINHTATLLQNGKVLIIGGGGAANSNSTLSAELFDPATGQFVSTGALNYGRRYHTATLLPSGQVLIMGGGSASCELYDPATGRFRNYGTLLSDRSLHTATLLPQGQILLTGGVDTQWRQLASAELFDLASVSSRLTSAMSTPRSEHSATLLRGGAVLIAGGFTQTPTATTASAELYNPTARSFASTPAMKDARAQHTATLVADGAVLLTGGVKGDENAGYSWLNSVELYLPALTGLN